MSNETEQIQVSLEEAKENIALRDALARLRNNKDWQLLIDQEYFKNEPVRLVHLKSDTKMAGVEKQESIDRAMHGIGSLAQFFNKVYQFGEMSENAMDDAQEQLENIHKEETESA